MEERNGLEVSFQRRLCFSLSIPANNLNWSRRCRVQSRAPLLPLLEKKTFSDHRRKKSSPSLSPLSFRLSMISCLTDGWDGKDDGAMVNVVEKLAQKPASPLVPSRHMKLSLDDLKALQEHIKDLLGPKDLKKIAGPTNIRPTWSMFLPWNSAHHLPPDHQLHFTFASKCPLAPNYAFRVWEGAPKCIFGCCQPC